MTALILHVETRGKVGTEKQSLRRAQEHRKDVLSNEANFAVSTYLSRRALPKIFGFTKFMITKKRSKTTWPSSTWLNTVQTQSRG